MVDESFSGRNNSNRINSGDNGDDGLTAATNRLNQEIILHNVTQKLKHFRTNIISEIENRIDAVVEDVVKEGQLNEFNEIQFQNFAKDPKSNYIWNNRVKTDGTNPKNLPEKIFLQRQSYLTNLLEINHMRTVYHIFHVIFAIIFLNVFIHDYVVDGNLNFGFRTIREGFGQFHIVMGLWCCMQIIAFIPYYSFKLWANVRYSLKNRRFLLLTPSRIGKFLQSVWNWFSLATFIGFQLTFGYVIPILCVKLNLPFISFMALLLEMTRFIMKAHAFVRTNVPLQLRGKQKSESENLKIDSHDRGPEAARIPVPSFSSYLYFLFAPTLIYRDNYPQNKQTNWRFAMKNLLELIIIIFYLAFIYERYIWPSFGQFGKEQITIGELILRLFGMAAPGLIIFLLIFYCILHVIQNFMAELLRFADRMFYKDWWTSNNFQAYYRDWNIVVHDWLYEYVYKDFYKYVFKGNKTACSIVVILISAIVHEYIISFSFGFVYPVMFVCFAVISLILLIIMGNSNKTLGNFLIWWSIAQGNGWIMSLYAMELFARKNCPVNETINFIDYFIPVSWSCNGIVTSKLK